MPVSGVFLNVFGDGDHAAENLVVDGTSYNNGNLTGSYTGGGGGPYPTESDVRTGVTYDSPTRTGTCDVPAAADVRRDTPVDATTGAAYIPEADDVRLNVPVDATLGTLNIDNEANLPDVESVVAGTASYGENLDKDGTHVIAPIGDVRLGVQFGFPSSLWSGNVRVPPPDKVELNFAYDTNDTVDGTLDPGAGGTVPAPVDVRFGVSVGEGETGTLVVPAVTDVRSPVAYDGGAQAKLGTCVVPSSVDVQTGVAVDVSPGVGSFDSPLASTVEAGTSYGNAGEFTGTLDIDARANLPDPDNVLNTAPAYGDNSDIDGNWYPPPNNSVWTLTTYGVGNISLTGTNRLPAEVNVLIDSGNYGPDDTLVPSLPDSGNPTLPALQHVRKGIAYGVDDLIIGNLVVPEPEEVDSTVLFDSETLPGGGTQGTLLIPSVGDVRLDEAYGGDSLLTGTLNVYDEANLPSTSNVIRNTVYGNALIGIYDEPDPSDVRQGTAFGPDESIPGTLVVGAGTPVYPGQESVLDGIQYGTEGILEFEGVYEGAPEAKVEEGFAYGANGELIGELIAQVCDYPPEDLVVSGTVYSDGDLVGTFVCGISDPGGVEWIG